MTDSDEEKTWGFHLIERIYSTIYPLCPKWANTSEKENWRKMGVVVWNSQINRVTHLRCSQALQILDNSRNSDTWKKDGLLVGEVAYRITLAPDKKSKKQSGDQSEEKPLQEDGWCLTNTIQLPPDQAQEFLSFLEQRETGLQKVADEEELERKRLLAKVYSMLVRLAEQEEQKKTHALGAM